MNVFTKDPNLKKKYFRGGEGRGREVGCVVGGGGAGGLV